MSSILRSSGHAECVVCIADEDGVVGSSEVALAVAVYDIVVDVELFNNVVYAV